MKYSCMRPAAFLALLMLAPRAWAQSPPIVTIDPASEHSRVHLSYLDATAQIIVAGKFDFDIPRNQEYKPFALLLTNASGKAIIALSIRWMAISADEAGFYDSFIDCMPLIGSVSSGGTRLRLPGQSMPAQTPVPFSQSHASVGETEVASSGERMLVAPGLFIRESLGRPNAGSGMPNELKKAETVSATLDAVVLQDGEVLGPDASGLVDFIRFRKATIDALLKAVKNAEQSGHDGVEALKYVANTPLQGPDNDPGFNQLRLWAQMLMGSRDWKQRLEKASAIQLPNFHR